MSRSKLGAVVVVLSVLLVAGCGGSADKQKDTSRPKAVTTLADGRRVLALTEGSKITVPAPGRTGVVSADTPVSLEFKKLTCAPTLPGIGFSKKFKNIDLVASKGKQLCLVELAVTNVAKKRNFFSSRDVAELRTSSGEFAMTKKAYDYQAIADQNGQQLASTSDLIEPGTTKYDFTVYEIPSGAKPDAVLYNIVAAG